LPSLGRFTADRILASDVRDLVVNRGTLLVIDDAVAALPADARPAGVWKSLVRHAVKGILGYGDALLYWRGVYHWSYSERQRRMAARDDVGKDFRDLYNAAMEFRFRPDYARWESRDLGAWLGEVRSAVQPVHLEVEGRRCGVTDLRWKDYPRAALAQSLREGLSGPREAARRAKALIKRSSPRIAGMTGGQALALATTPPRDLLGIIFPVVAYNLAEPEFRALARAAVRAPDDEVGLRLAFLRAWGVHGDPNFGAAARKLGLVL
jgi:hypothetical protein